MTRPASLVIRAGHAAARRLREEGFHPDLFSTLVGASGGPKWLEMVEMGGLSDAIQPFV